MDKEKEHIIADKTMLRVARITSIVFTPFSIPFLAFLAVSYTHLTLPTTERV